MGTSVKLLRRIFVPDRAEVTGGWRKLHSEELHNLYWSPNIVRIISREDEMDSMFRLRGGR
jgi:hypothetical protein